MAGKTFLRVCRGKACRDRFSDLSFARAEQELKGKKNISLERCGCQGHCAKGPAVVVEQAASRKVHDFMTPVEVGKLCKSLSKS